jgi:hypothetical protein
LARSSSRWLDRAALAGLGAGLALYLVPLPGALRLGFFVTAAATVFHVFTSHARR